MACFVSMKSFMSNKIDIYLYGLIILGKKIDVQNDDYIAIT